MSCYDERFDQAFSLIIEKLNTKEVIFEIEIGTFPKTGRLLNLEEAHGMILCGKKHKITYAHDPRTDVRLTKCIFDFIVRKIGYNNLIRNF